MEIEKRRYRIKGFRDDNVKIRILLEPADVVKPKTSKIGMMDMMSDPMGVAQQMMGQQMSQIINDSFSISREEYLKQKYMVGEFVIVSIERG